ncbi:ExbD/TolR family protein [Sorangium sp. So ce1078]|uniref:ExbD/TolR family protein n=1 Tax=Sorangium sp. So ce1078 TaxID=3133329 RepID=UPI003F5D87E2
MASAGQSARSRRGGIIEGINVTPLVDITLVLLIIFMVTAKLVVAPAVPLDLPHASQSEQVQTVLSVVLPAEGPMQVDGAAIDDAALRERAAAALSRDPQLRAVIQADRVVPHGRVMTVLDTLKAAGIVRVAFGAVSPEAEPHAAERNGHHD